MCRRTRSQREIRRGDRLPLPAVSGLRERSQPWRCLAGHGVEPQRPSQVHTGRTRGGPTAKAPGKTPGEAEGGKVGAVEK